MTVASLAQPTFGISGQNLQLSYTGQTATSPLQNTPNGTSGNAYVSDGQGDSAGISFSVNNLGNEKFTEAVSNPGSETLTTVKANPNGSTVTQTVFNVLSGTTTTITIKSDGNGQYTYTETQYSQSGISTYSSNGQPDSAQTADTDSLIKHLFA